MNGAVHVALVIGQFYGENHCESIRPAVPRPPPPPHLPVRKSVMPSLGLSWGAFRLLMAGTGTGAQAGDRGEALPAATSQRATGCGSQLAAHVPSAAAQDHRRRAPPTALPTIPWERGGPITGRPRGGGRRWSCFSHLPSAFSAQSPEQRQLPVLGMAIPALNYNYIHYVSNVTGWVIKLNLSGA